MDKIQKLSNPSVEGKIKLWEEKLQQLEKFDLPKAQERLSAAAATGDWQENAEYEDAEEQVEVIRVKIEEIKGLIKNLKKTKK